MKYKVQHSAIVWHRIIQSQRGLKSGYYRLVLALYHVNETT